MRIAHKLIMLIGIGFLGSVLISIIGFNRMRDLNQDLQEVVDNTLPSFNTLNAANIDFLEIRLLLRSHVLAATNEAKKDIDEKISAKQKELHEHLGQYEKLVSDQKDKVLFQKAVDSIDAYESQAKTMLDDSRQGKSEEAIRELAKAASLATDTSNAITEDIKYNEMLARNANKTSADNYESAKWILAIFTIAVTGFLSLVGWFIYKQVSNGLNSAQQTISQIEDSLDFTLRAKVSGNDEISQMLKAFNHLIEGMQKNLQQLLSGVEKVSVSSEQLQLSAKRVSDGSSAQNTSAAQMAASVEEMSVSISHVAEQAEATRAQSNDVGMKAEGGQEVISHTVQSIKDISQAVGIAAKDIQQLEEKGKEIESVVNIIRAVAEQTNLLALNAAIEAARAGEQGRGFAVVADEVRSLAARTATSTKEIGNIVKSIQEVSSSAVSRMKEATNKVSQGVSSAGEANTAMENILDVTTESVMLVADISHAIREQGAATNSIAQQVELVAQMVDENTHAATETADLASELTTISNDMKKIVSAYKL